MNCNTTLFSECLLVNFDLSKSKTYDYNINNFVINSLINYNKAISTNIEVLDFGLTEYDVARCDSLTSSINLTTNINDKIFKLHNIGENDASGNTSYLNYNITPLFDSNVGMYFNLDGGYLQNFFKIYGYDYELLPTRFNNGFTFETWVKLDDNSFSGITSNNDGIFLYIGARAENKFNNSFSGNTGYTTSNNLSLGYGDNINNIESGLSGNVLSFKFNNDRTMSIRYVDELGYIKQEDINKTISNSGWTMVTITFNPYELIPNFENVMDCYPSRLGDLSIYINGRPYTKLINFTEFWYKELIGVDAEKQIGVPYCISWGGGSFGLKNSWNYSDTGSTEYPYYLKNELNNNLLIEQNFNGSFKGGIQKLRLHGCNLTFDKVLHNFRIDNKIYNIPETFGGRLIYY